jgi:hypothetical protein
VTKLKQPTKQQIQKVPTPPKPKRGRPANKK